MKKQELPQLDGAGNQQSKNANLPPVFGRKCECCHKTDWKEKEHVSGGFDEFVIEPAGDAVAVKNIQDGQNRRLRGDLEPQEVRRSASTAVPKAEAARSRRSA